MSDSVKLLEWIEARLVGYGDSSNADFMHKLRELGREHAALEAKLALAVRALGFAVTTLQAGARRIDVLKGAKEECGPMYAGEGALRDEAESILKTLAAINKETP